MAFDLDHQRYASSATATLVRVRLGVGQSLADLGCELTECPMIESQH